MILETAIISDLQISQSTATALADRLGKSPNAVEIVLRRLESANKVISFGICDNRLTVWKLVTHKPTPCSTH